MHTYIVRLSRRQRERSTRQELRSRRGKGWRPEYFRIRLEGTSTFARPEDRTRQRTFLRIAAGLEDPSAADALR